MLQPFYSVACDMERDLLRITLAGFFTMADVAEFARELDRHRPRLRCAPNEHVTLCDASAMKIQTQDVVTAFSTLANAPAAKSRRMALIVGSSLARHQTQRVSARENVRLFRDTAEAERWLLGMDDEAASDARTTARYRHAPALPMSAGRDYIARNAA